MAPLSGPAPDSPRSSQSPPPAGIQGDLELELLGLANALYNMGSTVINDSTKDREKLGGVKQVGMRVNDVVGHLASIDDMAQHINTMIPMHILADVDDARNPMQLTKDRLERAATENQFMNGKISAIESYRSCLNEALIQNFPELKAYIEGGEEGSDAAQALLALKTLGKDPRGSLYLSSATNLSTLLTLASTFKDDPDASDEALRCIANALLLVDQARDTFVSAEVGGGSASAGMLEKANTAVQIFIVSRILFLCTASTTPFTKALVDEKHHGCTIVDIIGSKLDLLSSAILSGQKMAREAMSDLLKFTFNLLLHYPKLVESEPQNNEALDETEAKIMGDFWNSKLDGQAAFLAAFFHWPLTATNRILPPLLRAFNTLPPTFPSPIAPPLTHVIHALITIPVSPNLRPHWSGNVSTPTRNSASPTPKSAPSQLTSPASPSCGSSPTRSSQSQVSPKPSTLDRALSALTPHRPSGSRAESPAPQIDILQRAMDLLDVSFSHFFPGDVDVDDISVRERAKRESPDNTLDELLAPLLVLVSRLCIADETSRITIRRWIVPDDIDRSSPLEARSDILGRCLRLLGSVYQPRLKDSVGELLFSMADSNASTLSALVGYGNVAGYFFNKGIMNAPPPNTTTINPSLTTPSGTPINPITGTTEKPKPDLPDMTDEEKESEMEKLFVLFDRLEKTGAMPRDQNPIRKAIQEGKLDI
ncbi:hypothetical protein AX17_001201 [Amanita inopinata Kibby_2008]|nr:hypothetical protein AX17_001201 [Amanita inopinata Kibby_2008]